MLVLAALLVALAGCSGEPDRGQRPFAANSVWNRVLPRDAPRAPDSAALVAELGRQVRTFGPWINSNEFSIPIYTVPEDQPRVGVKLDVPGHDRAWNNDMFTNIPDALALQRAISPAPIPRSARGAAGTDQSLVVWQPSTDTMWELWLARQVPRDALPWNDPTPGWHASWGARIDHVSEDDGTTPLPFGGSASGLSMIGGVMRLGELERGRVDHALALAIPQPKAGQFVRPANRTDGRYPGPSGIPEGTRFRLDPKLDIARLGLPPMTRIIAEAAQRYGLLVKDTAGTVALYGEDPTPTHSSVYRRLYHGLTPAQVMARFPWDRLEVVTPG